MSATGPAAFPCAPTGPPTLPGARARSPKAAGAGPEGPPGARVEVHYGGVAWSTARQFDAAWDRGSPLRFRLGAGEVIVGWDQGVAGIMPMGEDQGDREHLDPDLARIGGLLPEHWKVYFAVDDTDAAVARATELGAKVIMPADTMPGVGRMAALAGPHGEEIMIIANEQPAQSES